MRRMPRLLRSVAIALLVIVAFSLMTGARVISAYRELRCEPGYWPRGMTLMSGIYRCEPRPVNPPEPVELPQVAVAQDEFGLYLTRLQVRVFYIDFVGGTYHGPAFGVRLLD